MKKTVFFIITAICIVVISNLCLDFESNTNKGTTSLIQKVSACDMSSVGEVPVNQYQLTTQEIDMICSATGASMDKMNLAGQREGNDPCNGQYGICPEGSYKQLGLFVVGCVGTGAACATAPLNWWAIGTTAAATAFVYDDWLDTWDK